VVVAAVVLMVVLPIRTISQWLLSLTFTTPLPILLQHVDLLLRKNGKKKKEKIKDKRRKQLVYFPTQPLYFFGCRGKLCELQLALLKGVIN
jgi:hypothetical protein